MQYNIYISAIMTKWEKMLELVVTMPPAIVKQ